MNTNTCEDCGYNGETRDTSNWLDEFPKYLCKLCYEYRSLKHKELEEGREKHMQAMYIKHIAKRDAYLAKHNKEE